MKFVHVSNASGAVDPHVHDRLELAHGKIDAHAATVAELAAQHQQLTVATVADMNHINQVLKSTNSDIEALRSDVAKLQSDFHKVNVTLDSEHMAFEAAFAKLPAAQEPWQPALEQLALEFQAETDAIDEHICELKNTVDNLPKPIEPTVPAPTAPAKTSRLLIAIVALDTILTLASLALHFHAF